MKEEILYQRLDAEIVLKELDRIGLQNLIYRAFLEVTSEEEQELRRGGKIISI